MKCVDCGAEDLRGLRGTGDVLTVCDDCYSGAAKRARDRAERLRRARVRKGIYL